MSINESRAFEVNEGFKVGDDLGPFITGRSSSPMGLDLSVSTFYVQTGGNKVILWEKYDTGVNDWRRVRTFAPRQISSNESLIVESGDQYNLVGLLCVDGELCIEDGADVAIL